MTLTKLSAESGPKRGANRAGAPPELPAEHALLGLLKLAGGTAHGYELARQFRRDRLLGEVMRMEPAMLYKRLKTLARHGWVQMTIEEQPSRPPRQVCRLTDAGEAELRRWLAAPVARTREIRLEFLVKLYFARQLAPDSAWRLANAQRQVMSHLATSLQEQLAPPPPGKIVEVSTDDPTLWRLVLELRLEQTEAAVGWLTRVADLLRPAAAPPEPMDVPHA